MNKGDALYDYNKLAHLYEVMKKAKVGEDIIGGLKQIIDHPSPSAKRITRCTKCKRCYQEEDKYYCDYYNQETSPKGYCHNAERLRESICWSCANATNGNKCKWVKNFTPIEGWKAIKKNIAYSNGDGETYEIRYCPNYVYDERYNNEGTEDEDDN